MNYRISFRHILATFGYVVIMKIPMLPNTFDAVFKEFHERLELNGADYEFDYDIFSSIILLVDKEHLSSIYDILRTIPDFNKWGYPEIVNECVDLLWTKCLNGIDEFKSEEQPW